MRRLDEDSPNWTEGSFRLDRGFAELEANGMGGNIIVNATRIPLGITWSPVISPRCQGNLKHPRVRCSTCVTVIIFIGQDAQSV